MAARKQKAPDSREQACMLCRRAEADPDTCGRKVEKQGLCAHEFCLFFANKLFQQRFKDIGLMGFLPADIRRTIERAARKHCFVCGESGATITCQETGCNRSFHLPCAVEGGCVTQFLLQYRSFCCEHRPEQAVEAAPEENTACLICLDLVGDRKSYGTMVCPACKHAWFHRGCIQGQAVRAGISCFQCPLCRDRGAFVSEMLTMGIRIPVRLPSWENSQAYVALSERHSRCDARECLCPGGREQAEEEGPWRLLLCCSCAAEGTHRGCSHLRNSTASWECDSCAGLGTASSASSELAGPSTASQSGLGPSYGSPAPDTSSPSTASQAPSGSSHGSPVPSTSSPSTASQAASGQSLRSLAPETSSPSTGSEASSGSSCSSTPHEGSNRSSPPGPDRTRDRSRLKRRAPSPNGRPRRHRESSCAPTPSAESSTPSQAALGPSHGSLAPETSSPSAASQLPSGSSCGSPALQSGSRSIRPGPERVRDRSRLQRRAQNSYGRPRRRRERSHAPAPSAESSTPRQAVRGLSHSSLLPETSSPSTTSQAAPGPSHLSLALETSNAALGLFHSSLTPDTSSPDNVASGPSHGSPVLEGSSRSGPPGPDRTRDRSQLKRRAPSPNGRPRRRRKSSCAPAPSAESSTPSQAALGLSHSSLLPETSSPSTASQLPSGSSCGSPALQSGSRSIRPGPERVQDRSQLKRRAPSPNGRPRRRRKSSCAPAPSAESSSPSQAALGPSHGSLAPETSSPGAASQMPSGSSCGSPALQSGSRSIRPGPERVRDRSRLQRRAQTPYSRPGRRRGTSRAPSPRAGPDPPPPAQ